MSSLSTQHQIESIQDRVDQVEALMNDRLPRQYERTLEKVYGAKWLRQTLWKSNTKNDHVAKLKRWKLDIGLFRFQCAEAVERLTRCLFELDNILSEGNADIRDQRKRQVVRIHEMLEGFEPMTHKSESLFLQCQTWTDEPSLPSLTDDEEDPLHPMEVDTETQEQEDEDSSLLEEEEQEDEDSSLLEEDQESGNMTMDEPEPENELEENELEPLPLPHWQPHTQWMDRGPCVHLYVDLPGMTEDQVEVTVNADSGVVRISGIKYPPTDLHDATLTYGTFDIQKQLRTDLVVMNQSRMKWHSGTSSWLELIIPRRSSFAHNNRQQYRAHYRRHPLWGLAW